MTNKVKCEDCRLYDPDRGVCRLTARQVTKESLRNCKLFGKKQNP